MPAEQGVVQAETGSLAFHPGRDGNTGALVPVRLTRSWMGTGVAGARTKRSDTWSHQVLCPSTTDRKLNGNWNCWFSYQALWCGVWAIQVLTCINLFCHSTYLCCVILITAYYLVREYSTIFIQFITRHLDCFPLSWANLWYLLLRWLSFKAQFFKTFMYSFCLWLFVILFVFFFLLQQVEAPFTDFSPGDSDAFPCLLSSLLTSATFSSAVY